MYHCHCRCHAVQFKLLVKPKAVTNCHCQICKKQNGLKPILYASVPAQKLVFIAGEDNLECVRSSADAQRLFCRSCGSYLLWRSDGEFSDWLSVLVAVIQTPFTFSKVKQAHR